MQAITGCNPKEKDSENAELLNHIKLIESKLFEAEQRYKLIIGYVKETSLKQIEAELRSSQERLALVMEGAKAGIWDWDMVSGTVYLDKQWKAILGYDEAEITGTYDEWRSRIHPDDVMRIEQAMQDYREGKTEKYQVEYQLRHKNGTYCWILAAGKITCDQDKRPIRWTGFHIDITDRKRSEELRLESERKLQDFAQAVPDFSFIMDEDGRYIEVFGNERLFVRPKEELKGLTVHQVLPVAEADFILNEVREAIASGMPRQGLREMEIGGAKIFFEGRTAPMSYLANGKRTVAVVVTDITERLKTERMLQASYQLQRKSDFLNDIVNGHKVVDEEAMVLAEVLGVDFSRSICCCLLTSDSFTGTETDGNANTNQQQILKNRIIHVLSEEPDCIVWDSRDNIGIFYQVREPDGDCRESNMQVVYHLREKIRRFDPQLMPIVGVGESPSGPESLYKSFRQALSAVVAGRCQGGSHGGIYHYRELGIFQLFAAYGWQESAIEFVDENIGRLINYDREKGTDYLATLEEILQTANLKEVAKKLFIHHKTAVFRKQRIEKILAVSVDHFETRLALAAAIKLHKLSRII